MRRQDWNDQLAIGIAALLTLILALPSSSLAVTPANPVCGGFAPQVARCETGPHHVGINLNHAFRLPACGKTVGPEVVYSRIDNSANCFLGVLVSELVGVGETWTLRCEIATVLSEPLQEKPCQRSGSPPTQQTIIQRCEALPLPLGIGFAAVGEWECMYLG